MTSPKRPRVIRKVIHTDSKGRPKVARDRKINVTMERMTARTSHLCHYYACPWDRVIEPKTEYAAITSLGAVRRIGSQMVPESRRFHFDCVPPEARPLVRFLVPLNWKMEAYEIEDRRLFTSVEAWRAWLRKNHPRVMEKNSFAYERGDFLQHGTNSYWFSLRRVDHADFIHGTAAYLASEKK